jgi:Tfp pilus assembly protein PilV
VPGATIDHLVAVIIFLVAILLFVSLFSQNLQSAILYQNNSQLATEASDLLDSISLSAGNPQNWGTTNSTLKLFGLQDPSQQGYAISPFSLMRLNVSNTGTPVGPINGVWYSNFTLTSGGYLLVPFNRVVNYTNAARLLGVNGSYGFQLTMTPILNISMNQKSANPLQIYVNVTGTQGNQWTLQSGGSGLPVAGASLTYYLINSTNGPKFPKFQISSSISAAYTNAAGQVILNFSSVNANNCAYVLIVYANLKGLYGVGYFVHTPSSAAASRITPVVGSFDDGKGNATILLARSSSCVQFFNATFLVLGSSVSSVVQMSIRNGTAGLPYVTGLVNSANPYGLIQVPNKNQPGILAVTYNSTKTNTGISLLPWGIGSLGATLVYGSAIPSSSNKNWVSIDVRQVMVNGESYQFKIALWSLTGHQTQGPSGGTGT